MTPVNAFVPPQINDEFQLPKHNYQSMPAVAYAQLGSSNLDGIESRDLALSCMYNYQYPQECVQVVYNSDIYQTFTMDNEDHYQEEYLRSFTTRSYNPGRMIVMGDAAFACCSNVLGSHGLAFAMNDALTLANLYKLYHDSGERNDSKILEQISVMFDTKRLDQRYESLRLARNEAKFQHSEGGWMGYLLGRKPGGWYSDFQEFINRGFRLN